MSNLTKYADFTEEEAEEAKDELSKLGGADFWKPSTGQNRVRFLPALAGKKVFTVVQQHYVDVPGGRAVFVCPRVHAKRPCPACDKADKMRASGNPNEVTAARDMSPKTRVFANIVDRANPEAGVRVFAFGKQVYEQLLAIRTNKEAGGNFVDPGPEGFDIVVQKTGSTKNDTEYKVLPHRKNGPLGNDEYLEQIGDLSRYSIVESHDDIMRKLTGGGGRGGARGGGAQTTRARNAADDVMDMGD